MLLLFCCQETLNFFAAKNVQVYSTAHSINGVSEIVIYDENFTRLQKILQEQKFPQFTAHIPVCSKVEINRAFHKHSFSNSHFWLEKLREG